MEGIERWPVLLEQVLVHPKALKGEEIFRFCAERLFGQLSNHLYDYQIEPDDDALLQGFPEYAQKVPIKKNFFVRAEARRLLNFALDRCPGLSTEHRDKIISALKNAPPTNEEMPPDDLYRETLHAELRLGREFNSTQEDPDADD